MLASLYISFITEIIIYLNVVSAFSLRIHHQKTVIQILLCPPSEIKDDFITILTAHSNLDHNVGTWEKLGGRELGHSSSFAPSLTGKEQKEKQHRLPQIIPLANYHLLGDHHHYQWCPWVKCHLQNSTFIGRVKKTANDILFIKRFPRHVSLSVAAPVPPPKLYPLGMVWKKPEEGMAWRENPQSLSISAVKSCFHLALNLVLKILQSEGNNDWLVTYIINLICSSTLLWHTFISWIWYANKPKPVISTSDVSYKNGKEKLYACPCNQRESTHLTLSFESPNVSLKLVRSG